MDQFIFFITSLPSSIIEQYMKYPALNTVFIIVFILPFIEYYVSDKLS